MNGNEQDFVPENLQSLHATRIQSGHEKTARRERAFWGLAILSVPAFMFGMWLFGLVGEPSKYDAYTQAEKYVKSRAPFGTEFRFDGWQELETRINEHEDGSVYCQFWFKLPGQKEYQITGVTMKRRLRWYYVGP